MKKEYLILLIIAIAIIVVFFFLKKKQTTINTTIFPTPQPVNSVFPLKLGSKCNEVATLQKKLNEKSPSYYKRLAVDGIFGNDTLSRLKLVFNVSEVSLDMYNRTIINPTSSFVNF